MASKTGDPSLLSEWRLDPNDPGSAFVDGSNPRPTKKVALAIGLLLFGTIVLSTGIGIYLSGKDGGKPQKGFSVQVRGCLTGALHVMQASRCS